MISEKNDRFDGSSGSSNTRKGKGREGQREERRTGVKGRGGREILIRAERRLVILGRDLLTLKH